MDRRFFARYQPLLLLSVVMALVVALAPSRSPTVPLVGSVALESSAAALGSPDSPASPLGTVGDSGPGSAVAPSGLAGTGAAAAGAVGRQAGPAVTRAGAAQISGDPAHGRGRDPKESGDWPWNHPWTLTGDRTHCAPGGQVQQNITNLQIPCVPRFTADNGGATFQGVTRDSITAVMWDPQGDFSSQAVSAAKIGSTAEERKAATEESVKFFNKHYEFYGRKIKLVIYSSSCGSDVACLRNDARVINEKYKPAYVFKVGDSALEFYDEMSRLGVPNAGGWHLPASFSIKRRPFHYDTFPDGDNMVLMATDYYCKKMQGKSAGRAGDPLVQSQRRKLGIVTSDTELESANNMAAMVSGQRCGAPTEKPPVVTISSDLTQQQDQMGTAITTFINEKVTTVFCLCGSITPVFLTNAADQQRYFPEHLCCGHSAHDHDYIGRLFSQTQWQNAFGAGSRPDNIPEADQDNNRAWRDVGNSGNMCYVCWTQWIAGVDLMAAQFQWAGPNLTPLTIERGTLTSPQINGYKNAAPWPGWKGGSPGQPEWRFAPGHYTAWFDARQVYWSSSAPSKIDGEPGSYVCVPADCRRTSFDGWSSTEPLAGSSP